MANEETGSTAATGCVRPARDGALLKLLVSPGAKVTAFKGLYGEDAVRLSVAAPPVDGRANAEVGRFLARMLEVPRSNVEVVGGASGRDKTVLVRGLAESRLRTLLGVQQ